MLAWLSELNWWGAGGALFGIGVASVFNRYARPAMPKPGRLLRWHITGFNPRTTPTRTAVRAWAVSVVLKVLLHMGFVVVLMGVARSGKTYLLKQTLPGKMIDKSDYWKASAGQPQFDLREVPTGFFAVDEVAAFQPDSLFEGIQILADSNRSFILTAQCREQLDEARIGSAISGRRLLVVYFGKN